MAAPSYLRCTRPSAAEAATTSPSFPPPPSVGGRGGKEILPSPPPPSSPGRNLQRRRRPCHLCFLPLRAGRRPTSSLGRMAATQRLFGHIPWMALVAAAGFALPF
eukprot:5153756-Pyramimonas_sp.AAC.1